MKELKKISFETMRQGMQTLNSEEERTIAGGATIDDWAQGLQNAGYNVDVYSDPNDVPADLLNSGSRSSGSCNYSLSQVTSSNNPYYLNEVIAQGNSVNLQGRQVEVSSFRTIGEYIRATTNTAWHERMANHIAGTAGAFGIANSERAYTLQQAHGVGAATLYEMGIPNDQEVYVSTRQKWNLTGANYEIRIYNAKDGMLICTTDWIR